MAETLADPVLRTEAHDRLRPLIDRATVRFSGGDARTFDLDLEGDLVALLSLGLGGNAPKAGAAGAAGLGERVRSVKVVAGARNGRERHLVLVAI